MRVVGAAIAAALCAPLLAAAPPAVTVIADLDGPLNLTPMAEYYIDRSGSMAIGEVQQAPFVPSPGREIGLGLMSAPVWVRFTIEAQDDPGRYVVEYDNPRHTHVDFYAEAERGWQVRRGGQAVPFDEREYPHTHPAFHARLDRHAPRTFYLRVENNGSMRFAVRLWKEGEFLVGAQRAPVTTALVAGMVLALAIWHLFVFAGLRERGYLYLAIFEIVFLLYYLSLMGYTQILMGPVGGWFSDRGPSVMSFLVICAGLLFMHALVEAPRNAPRWGRAMMALAVAAAAGAVMRQFLESIFVMWLLYAVGIAAPVAAIAACIAAWRSGFAQARLVLLTWGFVMLAAFGVAIDGLSWYAMPNLSERLFLLAFWLAAFGWSFALTGRIRVREEEMRHALEALVAGRTAELRNALREVKTLSGLLPICAHCKSIRDDQGYWKQLEAYIGQHTDADFSHSICPACLDKHYPEFAAQRARNGG